MQIDQMKISVAERLAKYSTRNQGTGCLEWHGYKDVYGYGILLVSIDGVKKNKKAHRLSYEQTFGDIGEGKFVCHKCDVRNCIEPSHLFVGSAADNNEDMMRKGRFKLGGKPHYGEKNPKAKLTKQQVDGIKVLFKYGISKRSIANSLYLNATTIKKSFAGKYNCYHLLYYEIYPSVLVAILREKVLKGWSRDKKLH